jgi:DNA-binding transcriptional ArsR family regulator
MSHSAISHQLRSLKDLDLVRCRKKGRRAYYSLDDRHIENLFKEGLKHVLERL